MLCGVLSSWAAYSTEGSTSDVLKVTGEVTQAQLTTLLSQHRTEKLLDFSEATGITGDDFYNNNDGSRWGRYQMCIFPSKPSDENLFILQNDLGYKARFAYFDPPTSNTLNVFVNNGTDATLSYLQYYSNIESTSLKFIYILTKDEETGIIEFGGYAPITSLAQLSSVPAVSIDFTWCSVSQLPTDFSVLHEDTHYITIALNGSYDFADEVNEYEPGKKYTYGNNIYVVSTYKSNEANYAKMAIFKGKGLSATEGTTISYVRKAGEFPNAKKYFSPEMKEATLQCFCGNLNSDDFTGKGDTEGKGINSLVATKYDFVTATTVDNSGNEDEGVMKNFQNGSALYLALPDNFNDIIKGTADDCYFRKESDQNSKCPALLCVGAYDPTSNTLTTWSKRNPESGEQIASVYHVTNMIRPIPTADIRKNYNQHPCINLGNIKMSGALNFDDISTIDATTESGLKAAKLHSADLSMAYFPDNTDMNFTQAKWSYYLNDNKPHCPYPIYLPTDSRQSLIPDDCFHSPDYGTDFFDDLLSICIPDNYTNIGNSAFMGARFLSHITTTDANGNLIDNGEGTYTFSANLASIGIKAFNIEADNQGGWDPNAGTDYYFLGYTEVHDIYVLAKTAPKCAVNTFGWGMVFGWGDFDGHNTHPVCYDNYKKNNHLITILHFPIDATDPENYTDVTRDYTLIDETGAYDGVGNPLYWPTKDEFLKAYNQAMSGVTWADNTQYQGIVGTLTQSDGTATNTYNTDYAGWHQFVLTNYGHTIPTPPGTSYYKDDYYTLCFPFDMSRDEVLSILGVNYSEIAKATPAGTTIPTVTVDGTEVTSDVFPQVYTLKSVTREGLTITLEFCQDLMALAEKKENPDEKRTIKVDVSLTNGYNYDEALKTRTDGEKVYIKGGYPYLVKPILPTGTTLSAGLAKYIMSKHAYTKNELGNKMAIPGSTEYIATPVLNHKVIATDGEGTRLSYTKNSETIPYYYYFQGTYTKIPLPQYAYFLGKKSGVTSKQFFRYTSSASRNWSAYSSIVGGKCPDNAAVITLGAIVEGEIKGNTTFKFTVDNDDFETSDVKYKFTIEGEDGFDEAVNIEKIDGEVVNAAALEGDVFNVAGQRVGTSIEGLSKGLYIVNGKKVLVK